MQFSEEWKSLFPISPVHKPPLLLTHQSLGPLIFNPIPGTETLVLSSPSHLSPPLLIPRPSQFLYQFITTSTSRSSAPVLRTTAKAVSSSFDSLSLYRRTSRLLHNHLEPFHCPNGWVLVFFPTGSNLDRVGFVVLSVRDSRVAVVDFPVPDSVFTSEIKFDHRIVRLAACPLPDSDDCDGSVGFLMACTLYSVHWFGIRISSRKVGGKMPVLVHMGSKMFKSSAVAHACWNPHLSSECVVLLESGALFMFDMDSSPFKGKRINVAWDNLSGWFSCEFSWHPRILVVANSKAVFSVDLRFGRCQPCCLVKIEMLGLYWPEKDEFVAFSNAGNDGFSFAVASKHWLLLSDVRKPLMPVLQWTHNLAEPSYLTVLPLDELRSHPLDEKYVETSLEGSALLLGSFWNHEFNIFCYGRPPPGSLQPFAAKMSQISDSLYAWELPSELSLSGQDCGCGSCLLKEEFAKDNLHEWVEWQQKKVTVLGFFLLDKGLSSSLSRRGKHGGFTLVRLMSSGKIETQQYYASWKATRLLETGHLEKTLYSKDSLLFSMGDEEYKFPNKFKHVDLTYLYCHLNDNLARRLFSKYKKISAIGNGEECSNEHLCKYMRELLKSFACDPPNSHLSGSVISDLSASDIFKGVNMPTSLYEIVGRLIWIGLPMSIMESSFFDFGNHDFDTVIKADKENISNELPPFFIRSPSCHGIKGPSSGLVSPVVPLPASLVLSEISKRGSSFVSEVNECSPEEAIALKCESVMSLAKEMDASDSRGKHGEHVVSLKEDKDVIWDRPLYLYEPSAFAEECPFIDDGEDTKVSIKEVERFKTVVAKLAKNGEGKLFEDLCPVMLNFDTVYRDFDDDDKDELNAYRFLEKQISQWQCDFIPYKDLCDGLKTNE